MKNLKKVLALVLSLAMIVSTFTVSFAAETKTDAEVCEDLGLIKGDGDGVTDEYLASESPRWKIAIMTLRLQGLYEDALAFEGTETFEDATDMTWEAGRAVLAYLKANPELGWIGNDNKIDPNGKMTVQQYYKVMLETLGYKQGTDFEWAEVMDFAAEKGLVVAADAEELTMADVAAVTVEVLAVENSEGVVLVDALVEAGAIDEAVAADLGLVEVAASEVAIKSAVALNSKVIKVTLSEAAEEVSVTQFVITDKDAAAIEVASVELAPWDTDNKTVLVTLAADSTSGNLYTVTSGATSVNFGGKAKDETKPAIDTVTSSDYNEVTITFKEAVRIDGLTVKINKKYADKAELATLDMTYSDEKTILVKTDDQAASTLYGLVVEGAVDLAGNTMDKDDAKSFVGTKKNDAKQNVAEGKALDYNKVYVSFGTNVDFDTLSDATFKLEKAYGTAAELQVLEARQATDVEAGEYKTSLTSTADKKKEAKTGVVLMVEDMTASTLYKLTVEGVGTLYGQPMSTTSSDKTKSFVGMAKPSGKFKVAGDVSTVSATSVDVTFERKVDKDLAEDIANYEVKKAYGDTAELAVVSAEVRSDGKTVRLTVGEMKNSTLYKMVITNLKDIYGNDQDKMEPSFVGQGKQTKISSIVGIERINDTTIRVEFNKNVGENATDVSLYFINNSVGYPESVATVSGTVPNAPAKVDLTIPETTDGKTYELAVKGLSNADGIAMDADGVKGTFVGRGVAATLPQITGVVALSKTKIELFFDRDVTDSSVKGRIWGAKTSPITENEIKNSAIVVKSILTGATPITIDRVYANPQNKNSLILVNDLNGFAPQTTSPVYDKLVLTGALSFIKGTNATTAKSLTVATSTEVSYGPKMIGIVAVDKQHLEIHFDQPVKTMGTNFTIYDDSITGTPISIGTPTTVVIDPTNTTKVDIYTTNKVEEASSSTDKDNQFIMHFPVGNVKGLDNLDAKGDPNGSSFHGYQTIPFAGSTVDQVAGLDSGIYGYFTDDRTLEIVFPQSMNDTTVKAIGNITLQRYNSAGTNTGSYTPDVVTFDSKENKAVVYFDEQVKLLTGDSEMKLKVLNTVTTVQGISVLKDKAVAAGPTNMYEVKVAPSSTVAVAPVISSIAVNDGRTRLTINMDKQVVFGTATVFSGVNPEEILAADQTYTLNAEIDEIVKNFKLKATFGDSTTFDAQLTDATIVNQVTRTSNNKSIVIELDNALKKDTEVKVTVMAHGVTSQAIRSINNVPAKTDSSASTATTGVASAPLYDATPATLVGAVLASPTSVVLTFDEPVQYAASKGLADVKLVTNLTTATAVAFNSNVVTITLGTAQTANFPLAISGIFTDNANNVADFASTTVTEVTAPTLTSAEVTTTTTLVLTFSESVDYVTGKVEADLLTALTATGMTATAVSGVPGATVTVTINAVGADYTATDLALATGVLADAASNAAVFTSKTIADKIAPSTFGFAGNALATTVINQGFTLTDNVSTAVDTLTVAAGTIPTGYTAKITIATIDYPLTNGQTIDLADFTGPTSAVVTITDGANNSTTEPVSLTCGQ